MDINKAKEIVQLLADGIDPVTGEVFSEESPYNNPVVIRALFVVLQYVRAPGIKKSVEDRQKDNLENGKPKNAGLKWGDESKEEVASMYSDGKEISELAEYFERTKGAIRSELKHQGLIEEEEHKA